MDPGVENTFPLKIKAKKKFIENDKIFFFFF